MKGNISNISFVRFALPIPMAEGMEMGLEQGMEKINILNQKLIHDNRQDDLLRSFEDKEFQKKLLEEYGI